MWSALYGSFIAEQGDPLAPLPLQYADYAAWQRVVAGERPVGEARGVLANEPVRRADAAGTADGPSASAEANPGGRERRGEAGRGVERMRGKRLSQRHGVTLHMTLLSSWAAVLSRLSGQEEVVIGSPVAGRNRTEVEALIGFFVNTLALRLDLSSEPTVGELLKRTKAQVLSAQAETVDSCRSIRWWKS